MRIIESQPARPGKRNWESAAIIPLLMKMAPNQEYTYAQLRKEAGIHASVTHERFLACLRSARKHALANGLLFELAKPDRIVRIDDGRVVDIANRQRKSVYKQTRVIAMKICTADIDKLSIHERGLQRAILAQTGLAQIALSDATVKQVAETETKAIRLR